MSVLNNTGYYVILIGFLREISQLTMNQNGELRIKMTISTYAANKMYQYYVEVHGDIALLVKQCAYQNVRLLIEGTLESRKKKDWIIAQKVAFLSDSDPERFEESLDDPAEKNFPNKDFINVLKANGCNRGLLH